MPDAIPAIDDAEQLSWPDDQQLLIRRITELSTQRLITAWMLVEIAAIAALLDEGAITAGRVWQLVLSHYEIVSSASSSSDLSDDPSWTQPLTDRALVWKHLTALCAGEGAAPVQTMPGPYDDHDAPEIRAFVDDALRFLTAGLNLLWGELGAGLGAESLLGRLDHSLRDDIGHHLAVQWFGGPMAVGASLHALPLPGGNFGLDDQPVYVLMAFVGALKRDIADYHDSILTGQHSEQSQETLGRIRLWWMLVKGYTHDMVHTHNGRTVAAMLVDRPALVEDLKTVLIRGSNFAKSERPAVPRWGGGRIDCKWQRTISRTPTTVLVEQLVERIAAEAAQLNVDRFL